MDRGKEGVRRLHENCVSKLCTNHIHGGLWACPQNFFCNLDSHIAVFRLKLLQHTFIFLLLCTLISKNLRRVVVY